MSDEDDTKPEIRPACPVPTDAEKEQMAKGSPELQSFRKEVMEKLGNTTALAFIEQNPGVHLWATYRGVISCAFCMACKQRDETKNGRCRGVVKVGLRG